MSIINFLGSSAVMGLILYFVWTVVRDLWEKHMIEHSAKSNEEVAAEIEARRKGY